MSPIPGQAASISGRSFDITARVSCASDDNGVLALLMELKTQVSLSSFSTTD